MASSIISMIEDLIDELEDSAYNREESYKISKHRNKISFALNNLLLTDQVEIKKLYRFTFHSDVTGDSLYSGFYKNEIDAYDFLDDFKEKIRENHEEWNVYHIGDMIELQEIVLEDVEDIDYTCKTKVISEIIVDEEVSEEKQIACWKDYEVEQ